MNQPRPSVCVLLAAFEGGRWIGEQLDSILCQYGVEVTVVISVDESADDTLAVCQKYAARSHRVTLLEPQKGSGSAAANFIRLIMESDFSMHDYVAFSDQDDFWYSDKLYAALTKLEVAGGDIYSCNVEAWYPSGQVGILSSVGLSRRFDCWFGACGAGSTYVYKSQVANGFKEFLKHCQGSFDKIELHDWFFYAYCTVSKFAWVIDEKSYVAYRQHDSNVLGAKSKLAGFLRRMRLIKTGWYSKQHKLLVTLFQGQGLVDSDLDFWAYKNVFELRRSKFMSLVVWALGRAGYFR